MIFNELYSAYYNAVAAIISRITEGEHSEKELQKIVAERAFGESVLTIMPALKNEKWQLVHSDMTTAIEHKPTMPLTLLQKQWLKSVSLDPKVKLFGVEFEGLDGVDPLFTPDDFHIYDKYSDGDPFEDEEYIKRFRVILEAIRRKSFIKIGIITKNGNILYSACQPLRLEYSEKDDKFRVITRGSQFLKAVNLIKIISCSHYNGSLHCDSGEHISKTETLTVRLADERNTLERFMLHFAHFEKQAEKLDDTHYLVKIKFSLDDETEMLIRILSFGPTVEVLSPDSFRNLIVERLKKQISCGLK